MRILFLSRRFYPEVGGVEKHVFEISKKLIDKGCRVTVITESQGKNNEIDGIQIVRISTGRDDWFKKFRIWREMWKLRKLIQESDVVHCHDVFFWYMPFRFLFPGKFVYTTFHGYESYPIRKPTILIRKISEKLSWGNICIGDFIPKWYGTKPTYVSYGAVEMSNDKYPISNIQRESALFIGRLDQHTGILTYTKAFEAIRRLYPKFELIVAGDGELKNKIDKSVKVLGWQKNPEKMFANYHFAFVSRYLSILEAFAAKRLVFAVYDNPVKEDYLKMTPFAKWIVIAKDEYELSEKIEYFLKHSKEEDMLLRNAFEWTQDQTWDKLTKSYLLLWRTNLE